MLELRPTCEHCNKALPPASLEARICSYECTFCATCVERVLRNVCPNCGGGFVARPIRPAQNWKGDNPAFVAQRWARGPRGQTMNLRYAGFSMMEILVVIAIVAILATLAVPSYLDKIVRDQIAEALPLADIAKAPLAGSWAALQSFPADNAAAGLPAPDKIVNNFVSSVLVRNGAIDLTFGNRASGVIKGKVLTLRAAVVEDAPIVPVTWVCGYAKAPDKMTVNSADNTSVAARYLPLKCR